MRKRFLSIAAVAIRILVLVTVPLLGVVQPVAASEPRSRAAHYFGVDQRATSEGSEAETGIQ